MRWPAVLVLSIVAIAAAGGVWSRLSSGVAVTTARAEFGPIRETIEDRGKTRLRDTYVITMPYEGRIEAIELREGDLVKKGQVVARIVAPDLTLQRDRAVARVARLDAAIAENDDTSVEQVALAQARNFVKSMHESVKAAAAQVTAGQEKRAYAKKSLERIEKLFNKKVKTEDDLDRAKLAKVESDVDYEQDNLVHSAMSALQAATDKLPDLVEETIARKRLHHAVLTQERAEAELARQQAETNVQRGAMCSPVDGVVLARPICSERVLASGTVLMEIGRLEDLEVEAEILSQEVVRVRPGTAVEIFGATVGEPPARGQVHRIYPAGFTKISSLGVEQQRVLVIIRFAEDELARLLQRRRLGVGYRVRVRVLTGQVSRTLRIPRSALFRAPGGQWQVFAVAGGVATRKSVQLGLLNDDLAEVTEGVSAGATVVISPPTELTDGTRVRTAAVAH